MMSTTEKRWFSIREAAAYSALSADTLRRMLRSGHLTPHNPTGSGRPVLIDRNEVDRVIEASAVGEPEPAPDA
jgi:excisionase family DNA binding protein